MEAPRLGHGLDQAWRERPRDWLGPAHGRAGYGGETAGGSPGTPAILAEVATGGDSFLVARNPDGESTLPYLVHIPPRGRHRAQGARDLAARRASIAIPSRARTGPRRPRSSTRQASAAAPAGARRSTSCSSALATTELSSYPPACAAARRSSGRPRRWCARHAGRPGPGSPRRRTPPARDRGRHPRALPLPLREPSRRAHARRTVRGRLRRSRSGWATRCLHRAQDAPRPLDRAH